MIINPDPWGPDGQPPPTPAPKPQPAPKPKPQYRRAVALAAAQGALLAGIAVLGLAAPVLDLLPADRWDARPTTSVHAETPGAHDAGGLHIHQPLIREVDPLD